MSRARALQHLSACLKGTPPVDCDWTGVIDLANQSLITPQLAAALAGCGDAVPADLAGFLAEVRRRNRERNRRLLAQLEDAVAALGAAGIEPVLFKGGALLVQSEDQPPDRLLSDLDLIVPPESVEAALAALCDAGFGVARRYPAAASHVAAELGRPQDVGFIDLHRRAPGPAWIAQRADLAHRTTAVPFGAGRLLLPDNAAQALHLVLHDQFHDDGYWRGGFDLRHLADLARLAPTLTPEDWDWLDRACGDGLVRTALEAQLLAAEQLIGGFRLPREASPRAARTYRRWLSQYAHPRTRLPLAALAALREGPDVLSHLLSSWRRAAGIRQAPLGPGRRWRRLRAAFQVKMGKI